MVWTCLTCHGLSLHESEGRDRCLQASCRWLNCQDSLPGNHLGIDERCCSWSAGMSQVHWLIQNARPRTQRSCILCKKLFCIHCLHASELSCSHFTSPALWWCMLCSIYPIARQCVEWDSDPFLWPCSILYSQHHWQDKRLLINQQNRARQECHSLGQLAVVQVTLQGNDNQGSTEVVKHDLTSLPVNVRVAGKSQL